MRNSGKIQAIRMVGRLQNRGPFCLLVCVDVHVSPDNFGAIPQNLHVNIAGPVSMSHDIDLTEFSLRG